MTPPIKDFDGESHVPVRIGTLRSDAVLKFDLFLWIDEKQIHYVNKLDSFDGDRLKKLRRGGIKKLYIRSDDEPKYLEYLEEGLDTLTNDKISIEERGSVAHGSMVIEAQKVEQNLETEEGFNQVQSRTDKVVDFLTSDPMALANMLKSAGISTDNSAHAATVASLTLGLAAKMGIASKQEMMDLSIAALTHDLGKAKLKIKEESIKDANYRKHPEESAAMLSGKKYITPRVLKLVIEHEELGEGLGFPEKKFYAKLAPIQKALNLCNDFDRYSIKKKTPPLETVMVFLNDRAKFFEEAILAEFQDLLLSKT